MNERTKERTNERTNKQTSATNESGAILRFLTLEAELVSQKANDGRSEEKEFRDK